VQGTAGLISCIIASTLFLHLAVVTIYPLIQRRMNGVSAAIDGGENNKLKTQVSIFLMALFAGDMFQSLCGMMQLRELISPHSRHHADNFQVGPQWEA